MEAEEKSVTGEEQFLKHETYKTSLDPHLLNMLLLEAFPEGGGECVSLFEEHIILEAPEEFRTETRLPDVERARGEEVGRDQKNAPETDTEEVGVDATVTTATTTARQREKEEIGVEGCGQDKGPKGGDDQYAGHEESRDNEQTASRAEEEKEGAAVGHVGLGTTPVPPCGDTSRSNEGAPDGRGGRGPGDDALQRIIELFGREDNATVENNNCNTEIIERDDKEIIERDDTKIIGLEDSPEVIVGSDTSGACSTEIIGEGSNDYCAEIIERLDEHTLIECKERNASCQTDPDGGEIIGRDDYFNATAKIIGRGDNSGLVGCEDYINTNANLSDPVTEIINEASCQRVGFPTEIIGRGAKETSCWMSPGTNNATCWTVPEELIGAGGADDDDDDEVLRRTGPAEMITFVDVDQNDARREDPTQKCRPSIVAGASDCASAPGCSRVSDAPACATPRDDTPYGRDPSPPPPPSESVCSESVTPRILQVIGQLQQHAEHTPSDLSLEVIVARRDLTLLKAESEHLGLKPEAGLLSSKELNKRTVDSRLKHLEEKLKRAGLTDETCKVNSSSGFAAYSRFQEKKQVVDKSDYDANQNIVQCEFDASRIDRYAGSGFGDGYFVVYDELEEDCDCEDAGCVGVTETMRGENTMGTDGERKQHNPDRDNLKSLLKKPNRGKPDKKNRVIFNENRNEFFDADYIILIREDCDYDEDDDDGVCTCNQHEMVRLTCCEPNCNCNVYEGYDQTPQSPKFAPPIEFVDAVTLSPPEGYKDMELGEQQLLALQQMARRGQMAAVCRECSQTHDEEGEGSEEEGASDPEVEREKTDQSQQTTPTTPPPTEPEESSGKRAAQESVVMTTPCGGGVGEERRQEEEERKDSPTPSIPPGGSPISGILKGGRLWKQQSIDIVAPKPEPQQVMNAFSHRVQPACSLGVFQASEPVTSDDEGGSKRSVRFIESGEEKRDVCDGAPEKPHLEVPQADDITHPHPQKEISPSPEPMEMMLTFKLGNHVMISNNSLKPNSAVRQLFPCTKPLSKTEEESSQQYLVTSESLRAFEEAKRAKLPQVVPGDHDESIKRAIERNTLRRSLIRYEPRSKKTAQKTDNSLVERIKLLTCDVDEPVEEEQSRTSPPGEEARNSPEVTAAKSSNIDKSFSPSSSSSSNSSVSSTYKKITDLFAKKDRPDIQVVEPMKPLGHAPDLGGPQEPHLEPQQKNPSNPTSEPKKQQFLSTLAPLTACVSGTIHPEDYYYHTTTPGDRMSMASSVGTEYSLEDIEEGLRKDEEEIKRIAPDVLAGTPSASESGDELAMFVQQDASRIERIKKKYQQDDDDDEHDDYGFNRRPSVRGIKPRFGSTTEILQQIQNQMQPPNNTPPRNAPPVAWPYYSETNLSGVDNKRNINQQPPNYQYAQQYRPTTLIDENVYQNCANQRCAQVTYRSNVNIYSSPIMRVGGGCTDYYQSLPRARSGRPQSPPPQEVSKGFHQTMMYIPYNHIEGYQTTPGQYYDPGYVRVTNQNQINKRYIDPAYQEVYAQKPVRAPYHIGRSESPLPGHFSTARSTQTPAPTLSTCTYYPRYRQPPPNGVIWTDGYGGKVNRHSFPSGQPRYPNPDNISLTDSDSHSSGQLHNGFKDSMPNSPTKPRFIERGVPEGAASVSPQDCNAAQSASTMTSPTSPQNPQTNAKPLFYAMNV